MKCKLALLSALLYIFLGLLIPAKAQSQIIITGKITNTEAEPVVGASVSAKGTNIGARSDADGNYQISLPHGNYTLVFSYVGMKDQEIAVRGRSQINVELETSGTQDLEELVVVGYGRQKITHVSGAISTVKSDDIQKLSPLRAEDAIQGQASGVSVIQGGSPGSAPTVLIRGIPSFSGTNPVVIIDGVPQTITDFNSINPADIESINILKDAATTAIYGVKGGNGVIVVTTKSGRNRKTAITVNSFYGIQEVTKMIGVLNATEYAAIINEGSTLAGGNVIFPDLSMLGKGTNWQEEIFTTAPLQQHSVSATGGSEKIGFFLSAGYMDQGGIVGGIDKSKFSRGNFTANLDFDLTDKLKFIVNTTGVLLNSKGIQENSFNSIIGSALNFDPTVSVYNNDPNSIGTYGYSNLLLSEIFNPLTKLENTYNKNTGAKVYGKFEFQYAFLKNLRATTRFGYTKYDATGKSFTPLVFYGPMNVENSLNADGSTVAGRHNSVSNDKTSNFNFTWESFANYDFKINEDHNFETVIGFSVGKTSGNAAGTTRQDVPFNSWEFADFSAATGTNSATNTNALTGYYYEYFRKNISYFGRILYDYQDKYLASFSARRDGSYAFGPENKFANFYAGSLGWVVSKEDFFKSEFIDYLKIRGSYGSIGNENVEPNFVGIITGGPSYDPMANSNGYNFGDVFYPGSTVGSAANPALKWESQIQTNIGFDMWFLQNKFSLSADYYIKTVDGLLFSPRLPLYLGTVPAPPANLGSTESKGIDLTLSYADNFGKDFRLQTAITFTTSENKVTATNDDGSAKYVGGDYFNGQSQTVTVFEKGFTPGYFYGYKTAGLFQNQADVAAWAEQDGAQPGDIRFVDTNMDGVIDADDQTQIGDPFPDFTMGWNLNVGYKNFDLNVFTYASVGNDIYRAYERNANYTNKFRSVLGRWTGEGSTNDVNTPRYSFLDANSNIRVSDRYVEDGSFIKIKNIQLGYALPQSVTKNIFSQVRIYAQVKNALTLTEYTGYDPEIPGGILNTGIDRGAYPQARTYALGIEINL